MMLELKTRAISLSAWRSGRALPAAAVACRWVVAAAYDLLSLTNYTTDVWFVLPFSCKWKART
jgi:hypothetical protein